MPPKKASGTTIKSKSSAMKQIEDLMKQGEVSGGQKLEIQKEKQEEFLKEVDEKYFQNRYSSM